MLPDDTDILKLLLAMAVFSGLYAPGIYSKYKKLSERKKLIQHYGPTSINYYVHATCSEKLKASIQIQRKNLIIAQEYRWVPNELIGRFSDISSCDICNKEFQPSDTDIISYCYMEPDEYRIWKKVNKSI